MLIDETHSTEVAIVSCAVMMGVLIFRITNRIKLAVVDDVIAFETGIFVTGVLLTPITDPTSFWSMFGFTFHLLIGFFSGIVIFRLMSGQGIRVVNPFWPRGEEQTYPHDGAHQLFLRIVLWCLCWYQRTLLSMDVGTAFAGARPCIALIPP
jgi:hypothetical protein